MPTPVSPAASRVFIVHNDGRFDVNDVHRYGQPVVIFRRDFFPDEVDDKIDGVLTHAREMLADYDPVHDYICLVGSPFYVSVCMYLLGLRGLTPIQVLRYDRTATAYYAIEVK